MFVCFATAGRNMNGESILLFLQKIIMPTRQHKNLVATFVFILHKLIIVS